MVETRIHDQKSLEEAFDLLHDARFDLESLTYDENAGRVDAIFQREDFEAVMYKRRWLVFTQIIMPLIECRFTLATVSAPQIHDKAKIRFYTFNECKMDQNKLTLTFCENMKIVLEFRGQIKGILQDLRKSDKKCIPTFSFDPFGKMK